MWVDLLSPAAFGSVSCHLPHASLLLTVTSRAVSSFYIVIFLFMNKMDETDFKKEVMWKQQSFHVTFLMLTFWWVWSPFVEILTRPSGCCVCLAFYAFIQNCFHTNKGWSQRLLLWWILYNCSWEWSKWTPAPWQILLWENLEGFTVRHTIMSREACCFLVLEKIWPRISNINHRLLVPTASPSYQLPRDTNSEQMVKSDCVLVTIKYDNWNEQTKIMLICIKNL